MSYSIDMIRRSVITFDHDTIGGGTHYLYGEALCLSHLTTEEKSNQFCGMKAGHMTDHRGEGRCKYHHGRVGNEEVANRLKNGRYAHVAKRKLLKHVRAYDEDPNMLSLLPELSLLKATLAVFLDETNNLTVRHIGIITKLVNNIASLVERIERIASRHVLTVATGRLMMTRGMEVASRFIPKEDLHAFVLAWRADTEHSALTRGSDDSLSLMVQKRGDTNDYVDILLDAKNVIEGV